MGHLQMGEACIEAGGVRQIPSPYGVGGETGYTAQEGLKFIHSYNMSGGRTIRGWGFCSCIPRPSLVLSALSSWGHHTEVAVFSPHVLTAFYDKCPCTERKGARS